MDLMQRLYPTNEASDQLKERGIPHSPNYLRKLRCLGTGPAYHLLNGRAFYTDTTLDEYIEERLSPARRSGAEHAAAAAEEAGAGIIESPSRKRGRPRKYPIADKAAAKASPPAEG
jgi:hypothetical protein